MSDFSSVKVSGRNGYEIRADLLELAQKHVMSEYHANIDKLRLEYGIDDITGELLFEGDIPTPPSVADVLVAANEFYSFVNHAKK